MTISLASLKEHDKKIGQALFFVILYCPPLASFHSLFRVTFMMILDTFFNQYQSGSI